MDINIQFYILWQKKEQEHKIIKGTSEIKLKQASPRLYKKKIDGVGSVENRPSNN